MRILMTITGLLLLSACSNNNRQSINTKLAGMYKLFIIENKDSSGIWKQQQWSGDGDGYIVYDGKGHMAVQITPKGYKDFKWLDEEASINVDSVNKYIDTMSANELKAAVREFVSNYVYVANYSIEDTADVIQHQRISGTIPSIWGTTKRRKFYFNGDTLILQILDGNRRLKWIRQP